jgi:hypothetical protein
MSLPKTWLSRLLERIAESYAFNVRWREVNRDLIVGQRNQGRRGLAYAPAPAAYGCGSGGRARGAAQGAPLFISARFRSGSTLLWNLFRATPGITAYYEPLNERRWFLPRRPGEGTDPTHVNVTDYWREYEGMADLAAWFRADWTFRDLYLDAHGCDLRLQRYLTALIERAPARPVLQCNRLDFRLAWLRSRFPEAGILVLHRNPREQWLSVLRDPDSRAEDHRVGSPRFRDRFYTLAWALDLRREFPFLDPDQHEHLYAVHYLLWRLSYLAARRDADMLIAYEDLSADCDATMTAVLQRFGINGGRIQEGGYSALLKAPSPERWPGYADAAWFAAVEGDCEDELRRFLATPGADAGAGE